jgi:hypothetical protein
MTQRRSTHLRAGAAPLLRRLLPVLACAALLLVAGCAGVRSSEQTPAAGGKPPAAGELRLVVSRDYGARVLKDIIVPARAGMTVMRLLAEHTQVDTKYGGGFIQGIDGLESSFGGSSADAADWFFWVDGAMGTVGAGDAALHGGQTVWWDYHRWDGAMYIPGALDAFPAPFADREMVLAAQPAGTQAEDMASAVAAWTKSQGITFYDTSQQSNPVGTDLGLRLVVGTPDRLAKDRLFGSELSRGPAIGIFVAIDGGRLYALHADGSRGPALDAAALATPDPAHSTQLCLVLIARDVPALRRLLDGFTPATASAHVALGLTGKGIVPLPLAHGAGS